MTFRWRADGGTFWLLGKGFLRNTGTDPLSPFGKKTSKLWTLTSWRKLSVAAQVYCNEYGKIMRQTRHWK